jgi:1-deoxyxylulose-5-phosphate synthase
MEYVRLGSTGLKVSRLCLGMMSYGTPGWREWVLPGERATEFVAATAEAGITFFDTADTYSGGASEVATGRALKEVFGRREDYVVATKVYFPVGEGPNDRGLSRGHIMDAIDGSLRRLDLDHVDLYQIHRWDAETPIEETMEALHDVVRAGKARYIGASSMSTWQFATAQRVAAVNGWTEFVSMQPHYNLLYREEEREMLPYCLATGIGVVPWSPLARGRLTRPPSETDATVRGRTDDYSGRVYSGAADAIVEAVGAIAAERGVERAQVALTWVLRQPAVTAPIIGATRLEQLEQAIAALDLVLTDEEAATLEAAYQPMPAQRW